MTKHTLLLLLTFVCSIAIEKFSMSYCNWQFFICYEIDNFCMLRVTAITTSKSWLTFIIKTYNTLMTTLELVSYLLRTDIVTCRSANAAKNAICDNKISNTINYNSRSNYYMHNTSIKLVEDRPTDIQTDQQTDRLTLRLIELLSHLKIIQQVSKHIFLKY